MPPKGYCHRSVLCILYYWSGSVKCLIFFKVISKLIGFLCYPGWMDGPSWRKVGHEEHIPFVLLPWRVVLHAGQVEILKWVTHVSRTSRFWKCSCPKRAQIIQIWRRQTNSIYSNGLEDKNGNSFGWKSALISQNKYN